jgi:hypothetical protein
MAGNVVCFRRRSELATTIPNDVLEAARILRAVAAKVEREPLSLACKAKILDEFSAIGVRLKLVVETIRDDTSDD